MNNPLDVIFPPDVSAQIRIQLVALLNASVEQVKKASINQNDWLKGKTGVATYLGVSTATVTKMIYQGLPQHSITAVPSLIFFNKNEINSFLLNDGIITK